MYNVQSLQQIEELRQQFLGFASLFVLFLPFFLMRNIIINAPLQVFDRLFLHSGGFGLCSRVEPVGLSLLDFSNSLKFYPSARYGRNKTRFIVVPPELDVNSNRVLLINAALIAGLFPKILAIDPANNQTRTISNNQQAFFHPSSVNFGKKPADFGVNHLTYFTLMCVYPSNMWILV